VRVAGDPQGLGRDPALLEPVDFLQQDLRVDDAAGPEHADLAREDPRRQVAELERLAVHDHRVAGVRAALVPADDIAVLREQVDDLPFAFVAPLGADDHGRGHAAIMPDLVRVWRTGEQPLFRPILLVQTRADHVVERPHDGDRMPPRAAGGRVLALELEPSLHSRAEIPVLGGALLADDGV
jgi:hypothetical protein